MSLRLPKSLLVTGLIAALTACSTVPLENSNGQNADHSGNAGASNQILDPFNPQSILAQQHSVYFEFASYSVSDHYKPLVSQHARYLAPHPQQRIRLEGHTDHRGSTEYNLALGQRRNEAVRHILVVNNGIPAKQIEMISYGKEYAKEGENVSDDEAKRAHDRRVDIVYLH